MSQKPFILIVDDEAEILQLLEEYFIANAYEAATASSAKIARAYIEQHHVDLAVIDIHMPGEDGLSLARHLRERYP